MAWSDEIADGLPAPRDDEPSTLREDIVDELSDHLQCALNRELHHNSSEQQAKQNVLDRFGNPARIASRLWFDWMKEKIMTQRITLATAMIMAVACLFVAGIAWQMSQHNQETNLAILDKLSLMSAQSERHKSLDWNPVKIRLVSGEENGPPAEGFQATLKVPSGSPTGMPQLEEVSGADGILDFGHVRYGQYSLSVSAPWGEHTWRTLYVRPGESHSEAIICPADPGEAEISIKIDWPDDLQAAGLWAGCSITSDSKMVGKNVWSPHKYGGGGFPGHSKTVLVTANDTLIDCGFTYPYAKNTLQDIPRQDMREKPNLIWPARPVNLRFIRILSRPMMEQESEIELPKRVLLVYYFSPQTGGSWRTTGGGRGGGGSPEEVPILRIMQPTDKPVEAPNFTPEPGKANQWTITLPDGLIAVVREKLAAAEDK